MGSLIAARVGSLLGESTDVGSYDIIQVLETNCARSAVLIAFQGNLSHPIVRITYDEDFKLEEIGRST